MSYIGTTTLSNTTGNPVPSISEGDWIFRRILKFMEAQSANDGQQRQRITVDAFTAGVALPTVTTVTTVSTVTTMTNCAAIAGMGDEQYVNIARNAFSNAIRSKLTFSGAVSGP